MNNDLPPTIPFVRPAEQPSDDDGYYELNKLVGLWIVDQATDGKTPKQIREQLTKVMPLVLANYSQLEEIENAIDEWSER